MDAKQFKELGAQVETDRIESTKRLQARLQSSMDQVESTLAELERFVGWHASLVNGETPMGMFGMSPNFAFFVSRYAAEGSEDRNVKMTVNSVELVIIPELLEPHELRVDIPIPEKPGTVRNTSMEVEVSEIVRRMLAFTGNAENVKVGGLSEVHRETCAVCDEPALVVACDKFIDDDNGRDFVLARFCTTCSSVCEFASYSVPDERDFSGRTEGIYLRTEEKP